MNTYSISFRAAFLTLLVVMMCADGVRSQGVTYNMSLYASKTYTNNVGSGCWGYSDTVLVAGVPKIRELAFFGCFRGCSIVDITTPALKELALIPSGANNPNSGSNVWREIRTSGRYAYITTEATGGGVQIVSLLPDVNNPDSVRLTGKYIQPSTAGINLRMDHEHNICSGIIGNGAYSWQADNYIYPHGGDINNNGSLAVLDVTNHEAPVRVGSYTPRYVHDIYVKNDTGYCSNVNDGFVDIINLANKTNPTRIATFTYPGAGLTHNVWVTENSKYLFTTDEQSNGTGFIRVHDISNLSNIRTTVASYKAPNIPANAVVHNAYVRGNYLIMSYYTEGVKIVDITEPLDPVEVGSFDTYGTHSTGGFNGTWGVFPYYPSGKIIASNINTTSSSANGRLYVLEFNNARAGAVSGIVRDSLSGAPIPNATITALDYYNKTTTSDANGYFRIRTVQGNGKRLQITAPTYTGRTFTVAVPTDNDSLIISPRLLSAALPVELASFTATWTQNAARLEWKTVSEKNNAGFEIERSVMGIDQSAAFWEKIGFVQGAGTTTEQKRYAFTDKLPVPAGTKLFYRLKQIDSDGTAQLFAPVEVTSRAPNDYALSQNYPNPFNPSTSISYQLSADSEVSLKVFNVLGKEVATLVRGTQTAGNYRVRFDAAGLSSGMYFYRLIASGSQSGNAAVFSETKRMMLLK